MSDLDYATLDPGIRDLVRKLREAGFDTTDSGDGVTNVGDMECALDFPHVAAVVHRANLFAEADRMLTHLPEDWTVEASWSPREDRSRGLLFARPMNDQERRAHA